MNSATSGEGGRSGTSPGPSFDPFDTLRELAPLRTAAANGDWGATRAFFADLDSAEMVTFAADVLGDTAGVETYLEQAAADAPADPLPRTLLAWRYIHLGWETRGRAAATHVTPEQFDQFHTLLRKAERILIEVCAEQPDSAPAWTARLLTARGLGLGLSEARRRYDRLSAHHPHHYPAQTQLLQQVCPKWGGSWEAAHGLAQECASAAPDGSHAGALVALAHLERWVDLDGAALKAYLRDVSVRNDLRSAARISVLHHDYRPGWHWIDAHSAFAMAFSLGGHFEDAAPHFAALGDRAAEFPWRYLHDPKAAFVEYRTSALATL